MLRVRILREHVEVPGIVGPVAQGMELKRAPYRVRLRRCLNPGE